MPSLYLERLEWQAGCPCTPSIYWGSRDSRYDLHMCVASALTTALSPWPQFIILMKTVSSVGEKKNLLQKVALHYTCKISFNIWINGTQLGLPPGCLHLVCLQLTCPEAPGRLSLWKGKVYFSAFVKQLWLKGPQFWDRPSSTESCFVVNITQHNITGLIYHIPCPQLEEKVKQDLDIFGSATWTNGHLSSLSQGLQKAANGSSHLQSRASLHLRFLLEPSAVPAAWILPTHV